MVGTSPRGFPASDLQTLFSSGAVGGLSDSQLLDRFPTRRKEAAFAAIIQRHGPIAAGSCGTTTTSRTPPRRRSCSSTARRPRSRRGRSSATGPTGWRSGRPARRQPYRRMAALRPEAPRANVRPRGPPSLVASHLMGCFDARRRGESARSLEAARKADGPPAPVRRGGGPHASTGPVRARGSGRGRPDLHPRLAGNPADCRSHRIASPDRLPRAVAAG